MSGKKQISLRKGREFESAKDRLVRRSERAGSVDIGSGRDDVEPGGSGAAERVHDREDSGTDSR